MDIGYVDITRGYGFDAKEAQQVRIAWEIANELIDIVPEPKVWVELHNEILKNFIETSELYSLKTYLDFIHDFFAEKIDEETAEEVIEVFKKHSEALFFKLNEEFVAPSLLMAQVFGFIEHGEKFLEILMAIGIPQVKRYESTAEMLRDVPPKMRGAIIAGILLNRVPDVESWVYAISKIQDEIQARGGIISKNKAGKIIRNAFEELGNKEGAVQARKVFIEYIGEILEEVQPEIYAATPVLLDVNTALTVILSDKHPDVLSHLVGLRF
ncbi:hypothetical protein [Thermococcus nautili]|uniref:Uncharacterized protein n=1 Tax=Thermococcus nautili TaxID=195522 RepID=W8PL82_9EURY|nr:hypothetical protein [Thermococcus nautili]AHL22799.1 hypothetical protein BD01_1182 [Thermococcus nautili]